MNKEAVIFDMDGVISDTQRLHASVESTLLMSCGIEITPEQISDEFAGRATQTWFAELLAERAVSISWSIDEIMRLKWALMRQELARSGVIEIPGARQLIRELKAKRFKLAVASSSSIAFIHEVLSILGIEEFDATASSHEVKQGKPAPDVFLLAADRLGVLPERAVVIEDGRSGMIGAARANMKSIGLIPALSGDYPATLCVTSLDEITVDCIHRL